MGVNKDKERDYQIEILDLRIQLMQEKQKHLQLLKDYNKLAQEYLDFIREQNARLSASIIT